MVLLTGASGFIGKHLLNELVRVFGKDLILAFTSAPLDDAQYLLHNDYNFDADYFVKSGYGTQIQTIIHAGAFTPKSSKDANDVVNCTSNITNANRLLQANLPNLKKIIYLSTLDVYGPTEIILESSQLEPASLYGESKLYVEKMIAAWANANNKIYEILRVGHVYGPGEEAYQKIIPVTIQKIIQGQPLQIWGTGKEIRSFIYIKDVVGAIVNALKLSSNGEIINLVSSQKITIAALVDKLIALSGKNIVPEVVPVDVPRKDFVFNNNKMKDLLFSNETPLDEGLLQEWNYMKQLQA